MAEGYTYSILKYRHSIFLGELLNIAVLVYFEDENKFYFEYPKRLTRVKSIYSNVSDKLISNYLKQIKSRVKIINRKMSQEVFTIGLIDSFEDFISNYILPADGSSLQFDEPKKGTGYDELNHNILINLKDRFLIDLTENKVDKEYEIGKKFYRLVKSHVKEVGDSNSPNFFKDYKVSNSTGVEFNFKYAWQNGSLNLVKPLNFDLSEPRFVAKKAHENYGLFVDLDQTELNSEIRFDLIIGEPKKRELFKEFNHSLNLLGKINNVNLIEEENLRNYTDYLIKSIS